MSKYSNNKTGQIYTLENVCKIKKGKDIWVEGVIYKNFMLDLFVRESKDFFNKFTKIE